MSALLILGQHENGALHPATACCVSAAQAFKQPIHVLIAGTDAAKVAEQAAQLQGVSKVLVAAHAAYDHGLAENNAALIMTLLNDYATVLAPASTFGKNILPRVSGLSDRPMLSEVCAIEDARTFVRPIYAGNALQTVKANAAQLLLTIRTTAFDPVPQNASPCEIQTLDTVCDEGLATFVSLQASNGERPDLTTAERIISGGRGLQSKDNFKMLERIADKLGAAIGASRAAVDAGFVPNDYQVGQTGKVVAPQLYIAVGISGAIQHLAGMKDSKVIVAINKDPDAPIFQIADYGLVGDLFEILPELENALSSD